LEQLDINTLAGDNAASTTRARGGSKEENMRERIGSAARRGARHLATAVVLICVAAPLASAQNRIGGHFGVVFPLVSHVNGETTNIGDDFKMGFPMGITVHTTDATAFDLEIVPGLDPNKGEAIGVPLTIHPGVLHKISGPWTGGLRMAFDVGGASWGFTPLLNLGFPKGHNTFVEFVLPIRFQDDTSGNTHDTHTAVTFGIHFGIGF
jgi:hypothetical protein